MDGRESTTLNNGDKPTANPFVILREEFDDWAVLFNPDAALGFGGFGLNPTGVYLWKLLDGEHSIDDLLKALRRDARDVPQEAGAEIIAFVEELTYHGLVAYEGESYLRIGHSVTLPHATSMPWRDADPMETTYEPPKLVDLSGREARGDCTNGSGNQTGTLCQTGTNTTVVCHTGNVASGGFCQTGTSPNNLNCNRCYNGCSIIENNSTCTCIACGNYPGCGSGQYAA